MKKSREIFIGIVVAVMAATMGAFLGTIVGDVVTKWLAVIALMIIIVKGVYQLVSDKQEKNFFLSGVDAMTVLILGGVIGSMQLIQEWIYGLAFVFSAILCLVFIFGFTGHRKEDYEE